MSGRTEWELKVIEKFLQKFKSADEQIQNLNLLRRTIPSCEIEIVPECRGIKNQNGIIIHFDFEFDSEELYVFSY